MSKLTELMEKAREEKRVSATSLLVALENVTEEETEAAYEELETAGVEIDTEPILELISPELIPTEK